MRTPCSPAPVVTPVTTGESLLADLLLTVVTPMFGGGVEAGYLDEDNLIRASAIRGHLRFWWRACNAARFTSLAALHEEERALWGSAAKKGDPTHGPGAIGIRVMEIRAGEKFTYLETQRQWRKANDNQLGPNYALFPFTPQPTANPPRGSIDGMVGIKFRLRLATAPHAGKGVELPGKRRCLLWPNARRCKEAAEQVLWAWIAFGGVGSRTRRGCGTLFCTGNGPAFVNEKQHLDSGPFRPNAADVGQWVKERLSNPRYVAAPVTGHITTVPMLAGCRIAYGLAAGEHIDAWATAIRPLQQFLQGEDIGRNSKYRDPDRVRRNDSMRPGQSFWPEVGAARGILNAPAKKDDYGDVYTKLSRSEATGKQFPRADLGLPRLIKVGSENGAPVATVERDQKDFTRMASPIILKALPVSANDAVPIAVCLTAPHIWDHGSPGLNVKGPGLPQPGLHLEPHPLNDPNRNNRPTWPRTPPRNVTDPSGNPAPGVKSARDAFMNFVASRNGWEVWP